MSISQYPEKFYEAIQFVEKQSLLGKKKLSQDSLLILYGLQQQALKGDTQQKASNFGIVENAKLKSWKLLNGIPKEEAMRLFVRTLEEEQANWHSLLQQTLQPQDQNSKATPFTQSRADQQAPLQSIYGSQRQRSSNHGISSREGAAQQNSGDNASQDTQALPHDLSSEDERQTLFNNQAPGLQKGHVGNEPWGASIDQQEGQDAQVKRWNKAQAQGQGLQESGQLPPEGRLHQQHSPRQQHSYQQQWQVDKRSLAEKWPQEDERSFEAPLNSANGQDEQIQKHSIQQNRRDSQHQERRQNQKQAQEVGQNQRDKVHASVLDICLNQMTRQDHYFAVTNPGGSKKPSPRYNQTMTVLKCRQKLNKLNSDVFSNELQGKKNYIKDLDDDDDDNTFDYFRLLYVIGGSYNGRLLGDVWILNLDTMQWVQTSYQLPQQASSESKQTISSNTYKTQNQQDLSVTSQVDSEGGRIPEHTTQQLKRMFPITGHATIIHEQKIYVIGGFTKDRSQESKLSVWVSDCFDLDFCKIDTENLALQARGGHTATLVKDQIFIFGGYNVKGQMTQQLVIFDISLRTLNLPEAKGVPPSARSQHVATLYKDNFLILFGGGDSDKCYNDVNILDISCMLWVQIPIEGEVPPPRAAHSSATVGELWYIIGGGDNKGGCEDIYALQLRMDGPLQWHYVSDTAQINSLVSEGLSLVKIPDRDCMVAFGGYNGTYTSQIVILRPLKPVNQSYSSDVDGNLKKLNLGNKQKSLELFIEGDNNYRRSNSNTVSYKHNKSYNEQIETVNQEHGNSQIVSGLDDKLRSGKYAPQDGAQANMGGVEDADYYPPNVQQKAFKEPQVSNGDLTNESIKPKNITNIAKSYSNNNDSTNNNKNNNLNNKNYRINANRYNNEYVKNFPTSSHDEFQTKDEKIFLSQDQESHSRNSQASTSAQSVKSQHHTQQDLSLGPQSHPMNLLSGIHPKDLEYEIFQRNDQQRLEVQRSRKLYSQAFRVLDNAQLIQSQSTDIGSSLEFLENANQDQSNNNNFSNTSNNKNNNSNNNNYYYQNDNKASPYNHPQAQDMYSYDAHKGRAKSQVGLGLKHSWSEDLSPNPLPETQYQHSHSLQGLQHNQLLNDPANCQNQGGLTYDQAQLLQDSTQASQMDLYESEGIGQSQELDEGKIHQATERYVSGLIGFKIRPKDEVDQEVQKEINLLLNKISFIRKQQNIVKRNNMASQQAVAREMQIIDFQIEQAEADTQKLAEELYKCQEDIQQEAAQMDQLRKDIPQMLSKLSAQRDYDKEIHHYRLQIDYYKQQKILEAQGIIQIRNSQ